MSKKERNFAIGAVLAAAAGYVAGILTAKKSGKETRQDIIDKTISIKKDSEKIIKDLSASLTDVIKKADTMVTDAKASVKEGFSKAIEQAKKAKNKTREVISSIHEGDFEDDDIKQAIKEAEDAIKHLKTFIEK